MKNKILSTRLFPLYFFLLCCFSIIESASAASITKLLTEYQETPMGIDVSQPRFSWKMDNERYGASQSAYRIMIATTLADLQSGEYIYDSRKIMSSASVGIEYAGRSLMASTRYYWQVDVWDEKGSQFSSAPTWFETGLYGTSWNNAQWIGSQNHTLSPYRSRFTIDFDVQIVRGSNNAEFIFGVKDEKNYVSLGLNISSSAKLILSHTNNGKTTIDNEIDISSIIPENSKYDKHHISVNAMGPRNYSLSLEINGKPIINPAPPRNNFMFMGNPATANRMFFVNTSETPNDYNVHCRIYSIGFNQPKGQNVGFSNIKISEDAWKEVLYVDSRTHNIAGDGIPVFWAPGGDISAPMMRKSFNISKPVKSARLYATARGIYEFYINDKEVGVDYFNPGWTDYRYRIMYNTFDVTNMLSQGANGIGTIVGTGWYSDHMGFNAAWQDQYGVKQSIMAMLKVDYSDGTSEVIVTDGSWKCYDHGPYESTSLFNGEDYNALKEVQEWTKGDFNDSEWAQVKIIDAPSATVEIQGYVGLPIRNNVTLSAKSVTEPVKGTYVYDFGQNHAGVPKISNLKGKAGQKITLHFAEMLYPEIIPETPVAPYTVEMYKENKGQMYIENYRSALSTDNYIMKGDPNGETYEPKFTFHGYRYMSISGLDAPLPLEDVKALVLESIGEQNSSYETSNPYINRLFENVAWGERSNFLSVPTDCPQRDERMGWTGDAQVFTRTASYNMNVDPFFTRWMYTIRDNQGRNGSYGGYYPELGVPPVGATRDAGMISIGWAEAGIIVPWEMYQQYGDIRILEQHYESMLRYMDFIQRRATDFLQPSGGTGDWLAPASTNSMITNTAYTAYDAIMMEQVATLLDKPHDAKRFRQLYEDIKESFNRNLVNAEGLTIVPESAGVMSGFAIGMAPPPPAKVGPDGNIIVNTQTSYVVPLQFDLFNEKNKPLAIKHLLETIEEANYTLTTGFVGTPYICLVLSNNGYNKEAYKLIEQTENPSWLYPVLQGATSFWERWDSYSIKSGFGPVSMNSFNHYAYGAIGEWMISHSLGIQRDESAPGYKHFILQPKVEGVMEYAKGGFESIYGYIKSEWKKNESGYAYKVTVPANTTATLNLDVNNIKNVTVKKGTEGIRSSVIKNGKTVYELASGSYEFDVKK